MRHDRNCFPETLRRRIAWGKFNCNMRVVSAQPDRGVVSDKKKTMTALEIAKTYFDAWNARDAAAVLACFSEDGTYSDPTTGGRLRGDALAGYMQGLWAAFPDLSFDIAGAGDLGPDLVAAQWIMHG